MCITLACGRLICSNSPPDTLSGQGGPQKGAAPGHPLHQVCSGKQTPKKEDTGQRRQQP